MYGIEISYSWGDCEDRLYGTYTTKEEAFKDMCFLAAKEAYIQNEEFLEENTCQLYFDASQFKIDLRYGYDNTWCYYRIKKVENARIIPREFVSVKEMYEEYLNDDVDNPLSYEEYLHDKIEWFLEQDCEIYVY